PSRKTEGSRHRFFDNTRAHSTMFSESHCRPRLNCHSLVSMGLPVGCTRDVQRGHSTAGRFHIRGQSGVRASSPQPIRYSFYIRHRRHCENVTLDTRLQEHCSQGDMTFLADLVHRGESEMRGKEGICFPSLARAIIVAFGGKVNATLMTGPLWPRKINVSRP